MAVALAGCGGSNRSSGKAIFERDCAACHTLTGREHGAIGGDLAIAARHLDTREIASFARVMPVQPRLGVREANEVARYIRGGR